MAQQNPPTGNTVVTSFSDVKNIITTVGDWMFGILIALAAVFIMYAAFLYLTAAGDEEKLKQAKNIIVYAIVAIVVGVLARGMVVIVQNLIPGANVQQPT